MKQVQKHSAQQCTVRYKWAYKLSRSAKSEGQVGRLSSINNFVRDAGDLEVDLTLYRKPGTPNEYHTLHMLKRATLLNDMPYTTVNGTVESRHEYYAGDRLRHVFSDSKENMAHISDISAAKMYACVTKHTYIDICRF